MAVKIAADNVSLRGFTIRDGSWGIFITESDFNIISGNSVTANQYGIYLLAACKCNPSSRNTIRNNLISHNEVGIYLDVSDYNTIYHNNFIDNTIHADIGFGEVNTWDDDYPSGGNYWSNSSTIDLYTGSYQNETGKDGLGDTAFVIEGEGNQDHYPLVDLYSSLHVHILSPEDKTYHADSISLTFTVTESTDWIGYSLDGQVNTTIYGNITIPGLTHGPHTITVYANDTAGNAGISETVDFSLEVKQEEPFLTWMVAIIVVIVVFGAVVLTYFTKIKKSTESAE
jgi:parallel beta-helix repeat protein